MNRWVSGAVVGFMGLAPLLAQQSDQPAELRVTSRAVLVDVVVTDSAGKPVTGIPKSAFSVTEDGKPQAISFFEEHVSQPVVAEIPQLPADTFSNYSPFPEPPVVNVLLLDSLNTPMDHQSYVHSQVVKYLNQTKPGTRTAVFAMGLGLHFIQGFTDNPALVRTALESAKSQWVDNAGLIKSASETTTEQRLTGFMKQAVDSRGNTAASPEMTAALQRFFATNDASRDDDRQLITLENLRHLASYLEGIPGRKNIVWFSEKVPAAFKCGADANPAIKDLIRKTLAMLAATRAFVYTVDPRALQAPFDDINVLDKSVERNCDQAAAEIFAEDSGGRAFINTNDFPHVIEKISSDSEYFYTLSYTPKNTKMNGAYREIGVKVDGGKYTLGYRRGYYAVENGIPGSALKLRDKRAQEMAARNPGAVDPLMPYMTLGMPQTQQIVYTARVLPTAPPANPPADKKAFYSVDLTVDLKNLDLKLDSNGNRTGALNVSLLVYDRYGNVVSREDHVAALDIKPAAYAAIQRSGLKLHNELALPKGNFWLRTGIYDRSSHKVGTLEIPLSQVRPLETATK